MASSVGSYWPQFLLVGEYADAEMKICRGSPDQDSERYCILRSTVLCKTAMAAIQFDGQYQDLHCYARQRRAMAVVKFDGECNTCLSAVMLKNYCPFQKDQHQLL